MKDVQFWLGVGLQILITFILAGGVALLVQIKEILHPLLFNTIVFIILLVAIIILVRLALGDLFNKAKRKIDRFRWHYARVKLAKNLYSNWLELTKLIEEVTHTGRPNKEQRAKYDELHNWFIKNRSRYTPIWYHFACDRASSHDSHYWSSHSDWGYKLFSETPKDPFAYFYEPLKVEMLDKSLHLYSDLNLAMDKLTDRTKEFVEWIKL